MKYINKISGYKWGLVWKKTGEPNFVIYHTRQHARDATSPDYKVVKVLVTIERIM